MAPAAAALAALPGCTPPVRIDGSFIQPWKSHLALSADDWRRHLRLAAQLGCSEIVLQWAGLRGGDADWSLPDDTLRTLLGAAEENGIGLRIGLPFDERWWKAIALDAPADALSGFLADSLGAARDWLRTAPWAESPGFAGWYLPWELEQYHWADAARLEALCGWLAAIAATAQERSDASLAISTYHSRLQTDGSLETLWRQLRARAPLRPMVQDGVGVAGFGNLDALRPLLALFAADGTAFDLIVELFEELPPAEGGGFNARTADPGRIARQLAWARDSGAARTIVYALDPWLSQDTPAARTLRRRWRIPDA